MNNLLLVSVILIVVGGAACGVVANNYLSDQNQGDGLNFNSSSGFGDGFKTNKDKNSAITQNNNLNVNNKITVINVALIDIWYQYIEVINVQTSGIDFSSSAGEYVEVRGHTFNIPNGTIMSNGYASSSSDFYSSEIYQTSDGCFFGIMVITNPNGTAEELANELANEEGLSVTKDTLKRIDSSGSIDVYKFESKGITHYIYNDGNDIVIIVMDQANDYLFMYMTNSSTTGTIDEFNPYYPTTESTDVSNDNEYQDEQVDTYQDNSYEDSSSYGDSYYDEGSSNGEYYYY
ncbi:hypothetical protein SDC9_07618 [bioreactor metagenome]|uniref:Uncharacterized protein n=1 Tax=bioreactor metagenome TaxID=1076179 RepID=A0A644T521_9ZZZZ|nr:hypothetical protein [Methanobrevibacter sp.]MEA4957739.1 hypothetical protein [Methanobrevibacter sp.]